MLREFIHIETACQSILKARMKPIISYKKSPQPKIKKPKLITHRGNLSNTWYTTSTCSHYLHRFIVKFILAHSKILSPPKRLTLHKCQIITKTIKKWIFQAVFVLIRIFSLSQRIYFLEDRGPTSWPKSGSSYFLFNFSFFLGLWAFMVLLNFTSRVFFC